MNIAVIGTGYVGLVTGVCLSEIGHKVRCIDIDTDRIAHLEQGRSPFYEPGLEDLMLANIARGRLNFTSDYTTGLNQANVIYIAVGTPSNADGTANLNYLNNAVQQISLTVNENAIVIIKSTVPIGTNDLVYKMLRDLVDSSINVDVVSNPEFLREGTAVQDTFHGDRVVIGARNEVSARIVEEIYSSLEIPVIHTDPRSAEMIKYASNAFLATKISFINEIANLCERLGANIDEVALGMGADKRIGHQFLKAGIGYGGSCFPKDTDALIQIAGNLEYPFDLLKSVIKVNQKQQRLLLDKALQRYEGQLKGKTFAVMGLAFKPNTDDMREAASLVITKELVNAGVHVQAYDPIALSTAMQLLDPRVKLCNSWEEAARGADAVMLLTEWDEFLKLDLKRLKKLLKEPVVFDGRNCLDVETLRQLGYEYHSVGRASIVYSEAY